MTNQVIPWIEDAKTFIGVNEIKCVGTINLFWKDVVSKHNYINIFENHPTIAWCSAFATCMLKRNGIDIPTNDEIVVENSQHLTKGTIKLSKPEYGCIVVFKWPKGGGHVGFVTGINRAGSIIVLGGNQNDSVCEKAFSTRNVVGYYWPEGASHIPDGSPLPVYDMALEKVRT